jgi:hypothetical protein
MLKEALIKTLPSEEKLDCSSLSDTDVSLKVVPLEWRNSQGLLDVEIRLQELDYEIREYNFPYYVAVITVLIFNALEVLALIAWIIFFQENIMSEEKTENTNAGVLEMELMMRNVGIILLILTNLGLMTQMVGIKAYKKRVLQWEVYFIYMVFLQLVFEIAVVFFSAVNFYEMFVLLPFTILQLSLNIYQIMSSVRLLGLLKEHELFYGMKTSRIAV